MCCWEAKGRNCKMDTKMSSIHYHPEQGEERRGEEESSTKNFSYSYWELWIQQCLNANNSATSCLLLLTSTLCYIHTQDREKRNTIPNTNRLQGQTEFSLAHRSQFLPPHCLAGLSSVSLALFASSPVLSQCNSMMAGHDPERDFVPFVNINFFFNFLSW